MVGKVGNSTPSALAETIVQKCPARSPISVTLDRSGEVWMQPTQDADVRELVGVYMRGSDPDVIAGDIEFVAQERGLL